MNYACKINHFLWSIPYNTLQHIPLYNKLNLFGNHIKLDFTRIMNSKFADQWKSYYNGFVKITKHQNNILLCQPRFFHAKTSAQLVLGLV